MSKDYESILPLENPIFPLVGTAASALEIKAYVVGGYVRDYLLKRSAPQDIDFVTEGNGIALAQYVASKLKNKPKVQIFKTFGTAMVRYGNLDLEFVGARKESYRFDSRKPLIENGTLLEDLARRDLTINAMAVSLDHESFGSLIDPYNGLNDLKLKILRTPKDADSTYSDDPLRMLRVIRFASQLDFKIENESFAAIKRNKARLKIISQERIIEELNKILMSSKPSIGFSLLYETGLLDLILPELTALQGVEEKEGNLHKDNFFHTLEVLDNITAHTDNLWLRWTALLHDIGKANTKRFQPPIGWTFHGHEFVGGKMVPKIFKRLHMPLNDKMKYVQKLVKLSSRPIILSEDIVTDSAVRRLIFDAGEDIDDLMTLCEADITTKNPKRFRRYHENFQLVRRKIEEVEERDRIRNFQPPISGEEIMEIFELRPSREIGIIKEYIKEAILEGTIPNERTAAWTLMLDKAREMGLEPKK